MVDLHTHILPFIDDGATDIDESVKILAKAKAAGFEGVVASSHYIEGAYNANNSRKRELIEMVNDELKKQNIDIRVYPGNEVFITENLVSLLEKDEIFSVNNSKYVLMEFPMNEELQNIQNMIFRFSSAHIVPIIAHPERYRYVQENPNYLIPLIDQGLLFQMNSGSILGKYGKSAQKTAKILLENNMIHFISTDTHTGKTANYEDLIEAKLEISNIVGKRKTDVLFEKNPKLVVLNKQVVADDPTEYKKSFFDFFRK